MQDKFNMSVEENVFYAKRNIVDYIWKSARLEGINVTYPETDAIFNDINVSSLNISSLITINNLKHAWDLVLSNLDEPLSYNLLLTINQRVGAGLIYGSGDLRTVPVSIGGTEWKPPMIIESKVKEELQQILSLPNPTERAITLALYCMRSQLFTDGNKRTAMLAANHILISNGKGILTIPIEHQIQFGTLLTQYYETGNQTTITQFLLQHCIDGIETRRT